MPRPRTPTEVLDTRGAFIRDPSSRRPNEPTTSRPLGGPPKYLSESEAEVWREIKRTLLPGVAKYSDRHAFASLVMLNTKDRLGIILPAERAQLLSLYGKFAMTPADRSKVFVEQKPKNSLSDFLSKKSNGKTQEQNAVFNTIN